MAVAIDARATADAAQTNATTLDLTTLTVGAGSNRALVIQINFAGNPGTVTVNWDALGTPQVCAQIITASGTNVVARLYGLINPTSGNKTLRVTTTNLTDIAIFAIAFTGVDQTGGVTSFPNSTSATASTANPSFAITSAVGDWTVSLLTDASANMSAPSQTQDYVDTSLAGCNAAGQDGTGAASVTHSWTCAANNWVMSGTSVKASGAAAASSSPLAAAINTEYEWIGGEGNF